MSIPLFPMVRRGINRHIASGVNHHCLVGGDVDIGVGRAAVVRDDEPLRASHRRRVDHGGARCARVIQDNPVAAALVKDIRGIARGSDDIGVAGQQDRC